MNWFTRIFALIGSGALLCACAGTADPKYRISSLDDGSAGTDQRRLMVVPATLKVRPDQLVGAAFRMDIDLHAARGEAESAQILFYSGNRAVAISEIRVNELVSDSGAAIRPEIKTVGYVWVDNPSFVGFHQRGAYPDPLLPDTTIAIPARTNRSLYFTVLVPADAAADQYGGSVTLTDSDGAAWTIPVALHVYDVALPKTSFLKTSVNFRRENFRDERYYGESWTAVREAELPRLGLDYRFSARVALPLEAVFASGLDGATTADWTEFDAATAHWLELGITVFELQFKIVWNTAPDEIAAKYGAKLRLIDEHLQTTGRTDLFYFCNYSGRLSHRFTAYSACGMNGEPAIALASTARADIPCLHAVER